MTDRIVPTWWSGFHAGDLDAFSQLIACHQDDVFAVARATVIDRGLAEDVAQETFIAAFQHRDRLRDPAAIGGWLAAIARNLGRDVLRARRRERLVELPVLGATGDDDSPVGQLAHAALCRHVREALARVPATYREVLILYYAHERSVDAIAKSLGLTATATMQRLSRGRRLVRQHGAELRALVEPARPGRPLVLTVLALLAIRGRAEAAPPPALRPAPGRRAVTAWAAGCAIVVGLVGIERASGSDPRDEVVARTAAIAPLTPIAPTASGVTLPAPATSVAGAPPSVTPPADPTRAARAAPAVRSPTSPPPGRHAARVTTAVTADPRDTEPRPVAAPVPPAIATTAPVTATPQVEQAAPVAGCEDCKAAPVTAVPPPERAIDQINGLLETAALPRAGDISYETVGITMMVRAGLTRHVAAHVGMTALDTNPAFGGGLKIGARISRSAAVAVLVEGAREVNVKTLDAKEGWIGRAFAGLTLGTARHNTTLLGGLIGRSDGDDAWDSPMLGITTQLGWDDRLAFILEGQYFTKPKGTLGGTSVFAVRFRTDAKDESVLGIERARIDVGVLLLNETDGDSDGLPWLQVGLGW